MATREEQRRPQSTRDEARQDRLPDVVSLANPSVYPSVSVRGVPIPRLAAATDDALQEMAVLINNHLRELYRELDRLT